MCIYAIWPARHRSTTINIDKKCSYSSKTLYQGWNANHIKMFPAIIIQILKLFNQNCNNEYTLYIKNITIDMHRSSNYKVSIHTIWAIAHQFKWWISGHIYPNVWWSSVSFRILTTNTLGTRLGRGRVFISSTWSRCVRQRIRYCTIMRGRGTLQARPNRMWLPRPSRRYQRTR